MKQTPPSKEGSQLPQSMKIMIEENKLDYNEEEDDKHTWIIQNLIIKEGQEKLIKSAIKDDEYKAFREKIISPNKFILEAQPIPNNSKSDKVPSKGIRECLSSSDEDGNDIMDDEKYKQLLEQKQSGKATHLNKFKLFLDQYFEKYPQGEKVEKIYQEFLENQKKIAQNCPESSIENSNINSNQKPRAVSFFWEDSSKPKPLPILKKRKKVFNKKQYRLSQKTPAPQKINKPKFMTLTKGSELNQDIPKHTENKISSFNEEKIPLPGLLEQMNLSKDEGSKGEGTPPHSLSMSSNERKEVMIQAPYKDGINEPHVMSKFYVKEKPIDSSDEEKEENESNN